MNIGKLGVFNFTEGMSAKDAAAFAQRIEKWGYSALWQPEAVGRNVLVHSSWLLANTKTLIIATGIANIYGRDPFATAAGQMTLSEQSGGRFLLGLGVSHGPMVEMRGHAYEKPVPKMRSYLEAMATLQYMAVPPAEKPKTVIAALGPKMLELAKTHCDGAHPYNVTPEHTATSREILGPGKLLCTEQMVLLETDPSKARAAARQTLGMYLQMPNYRNNLKRLGFSEDDLGALSDKLMDALVAWGDESAIRKRVQEHWDAGADHVCIQVIPPEGRAFETSDEKVYELLAPAKG